MTTIDRSVLTAAGPDDLAGRRSPASSGSCSGSCGCAAAGAASSLGQVAAADPPAAGSTGWSSPGSVPGADTSAAGAVERVRTPQRVGIRREDKSRWEARTPLVPDDVARLIEGGGEIGAGIPITVQRSDIRAFADTEYAEVGARLSDTLDDSPIVIAVKEIPVRLIRPGHTYVCFAHVIKGQRENMPALARYLELGCTLIDYEKITDDAGRRLVFFGRHAGIAGMIDTLWALGRRLDLEGARPNPFRAVRPAHEYVDAAAAGAMLRTLGATIEREGLPESINPFVVGFAGYGQVSKGAQTMFDHLPFRQVDADHLAEEMEAARRQIAEDGRPVILKVVFHEHHMVKPLDASQAFDLQEYYQHPERFESIFDRHTPHLSVLVNAIYWEPKYPRLITAEQFRALYADPARPPRLKVIGDISCDVDGAVACTRRCTSPDSPIYVYDPATGETHDGVEGNGPVVLAVDFLPCEVPVDASRFFSQAIRPFIPGLACADYATAETVEQAGLPPELERATIVYRGRLTPRFAYLARYLPARSPSSPAPA